MRPYEKPSVQNSGSLHEMTLSQICKARGGSDVVMYSAGNLAHGGGVLVRHS